MEREQQPSESVESLRRLIDERTRELMGALHARMAQQDLTIADLEDRVEALEEALRLLGGSGRSP